jgi:hypothetical protein
MLILWRRDDSSIVLSVNARRTQRITCGSHRLPSWGKSDQRNALHYRLLASLFKDGRSQSCFITHSAYNCPRKKYLIHRIPTSCTTGELSLIKRNPHQHTLTVTYSSSYGSTAQNWPWLSLFEVS